MTKNEKQLLLKDLCGRLPYGVFCDRLGQAKKLLSVSPYKVYCLEFDRGEYMPTEYTVDDVKPYLRPMSSMTEEEKEEFISFNGTDGCYIKTMDFCNKHHLDNRGLIPMGLALDAPLEMYKI